MGFLDGFLFLSLSLTPASSFPTCFPTHPQMAVSWDVWTFNQTFTGMVPELGVSRLVTSHREQHSDTIVRRGLAARFEHGFMDTPEGRAHYFLTLAQIANAVRVRELLFGGF